MRRRALLAISSSSERVDFGELPPESTEFAFPLYLNITELSFETTDYIEYVRPEDNITTLLRTWFFNNATNSVAGYSNVILNDTNRVYINGEPVIEMRKYEYNTEIIIYLNNNVFDDVILDGVSLWGVIYK